jgi:hypothetical protein
MQEQGSAAQLAIFRILLGLQILYSSSSKLLDLLLVVKGTHKPTIFPDFFNSFISIIALPYLQIANQILSIFLILGLFTRYILPLLFVSFLLLFSFWYSKFDAPVPWLYIWFPLLILCFSRSEDEFSLDKIIGLGRKSKPLTNTYRWPIEVICGWFAYIYFAAGFAKIIPITKGLNWLDGGTSQRIIYDRFLDSVFYWMFQEPFFDYTLNQWIFALLSIGSLIIELFCAFIFFTNRFNYIIIFLVMSMHLFLYLIGVPGFFQLAAITSVCLIRPEFFLQKKRKFVNNEGR